MSPSQPIHAIRPSDFDGFLFDLDGVITSTDKVHFAAWKKLFDRYLKARAEKDGSTFREFTEEDMLRHVDGRPRYDGIQTFFESRGIELPFGDPSDSEDAETVCGLGNRKNRYFNAVLKTEGAEVFEGSLALIHALRDAGIKCAVVSSSKNCKTVLDVVGIAELFDVRFDGNHGAELNLKGKPTPDTYLTAAEWLEVDPARAAVVEDAISGVQAGRAGQFGLVVGVDRGGNAEGLKQGGADIVVTDLDQIRLEK